MRRDRASTHAIPFLQIWTSHPTEQHIRTLYCQYPDVPVEFVGCLLTFKLGSENCEGHGRGKES